MLLRRILTWSACLSVFAVTAQACPDHGAKAAVTLQPRTSSAAALVAWKPRAWTLPGAPGTAGLRVSIDPADGTLGMPVSDELSTSAGEEDMRPVSMVRRANGSGRAQLDERWASHAMATIGPDGKLRWTCVDGKFAAERYLKQAATTAPATVSVPSAPVWEEK